MDLLAAGIPQRERECSVEVGGIGGRQVVSVGHGREWRDRDGRSCLHLPSFPCDRMKAVWPDDLPSPTVSNIVPSVKPERSYESYRFIQAVEAPENLDISLPNDTKPLVWGGGAFNWNVRAFHLTVLKASLSFG